MIKSKIIYLMLTTSILAGCTNHLEVERVSQSEPTVTARSGFPYHLQFTQYKVVLSWRVVDCDLKFKTTVKAEITPESVNDGDYAYTIRSDSLISPMKISDMKIEWDKGKLKLINASAEDRTAQTVLAAVQGIGKIASSGILGVVSEGQSPEGCTAATRTALADRATAETDVNRITEEVTDLTGEVTRLKAQLMENSGDRRIQSDLGKALGKLDGAKLRLGEAQSRLKKALGVLTYERTISWPDRSNVFHTDKPFLPPRAVIEKWFEVPDPERRDRKYDELAKQMAVFLRLERVGSYGIDPTIPLAAGGGDVGSARNGLRFRIPAQGRLVVCEVAMCASNDDENVVTVSAGPVLQLGHIYYASFSSPPFTNGGFEMAFDENGIPTKAGIGRKSSSAETAAGLFRDLAGEGSSIYNALHETPEEKAAKRLAALETAKKIADAEAALDPNSPAKQLAALQMAKQLSDATAALATSPSAELIRLATIAEAQRRYDVALAALAADPNEDTRVQITAFEADAALLRAEAARIEAEILARDARKRLGQQ